VGWRWRPAALEVVDAQALLSWAQSQPVELGLVRIKEEACLKELKAYAEQKGEVPPGMRASPGVEELQIRVETAPAEVL
jgi:hypothetical protein